MSDQSLTLLERLVRAYSLVAPTGRGGYRLARLARGSRGDRTAEGEFIRPDGLRLTLDLAVYPDVSIAYGLYELDTIRLLQRHLRPGAHFVDCGANLGLFSLKASRLVGSKGRVDAIEPEPHNRTRLLEHVNANNVTNVTIHDAALSDHAGIATIHFPPPRHFSNHGTSSFYAPTTDSTPTQVRTARLDDLLPVDASPDLIKLDVEGAEPLAIDGMQRVLSAAQPPTMIVEHNPTTAARGGFAPEEWARRLLAIQPRYRMWRVGWRLTPLRDSLRELASAPEVNILVRADR